MTGPFLVPPVQPMHVHLLTPCDYQDGPARVRSPGRRRRTVLAIAPFRSKRGRRRPASTLDVIRAVHHASDGADVIATGTDAISRLYGADVTFWRTTGRSVPVLAGPSGEFIEPEQGTSHLAPRAVMDTARRGRETVTSDGRTMTVALPVRAVDRTMLGVLHVDHLPDDEDLIADLTDLAIELGAALGRARDVEDLRARTQDVEDLFTAQPGATMVTDAQGTVLATNPGVAAITGTTPEAGRPCAAALGLNVGERPLDCSEGCPLVKEAEATSHMGQEVWRRQANGRRQPVLVSARELPDGRVVHSLWDASAVKEAEEAKTLFLATASHELKTPLTVIRGFAQLLSSSRLTDESARAEAIAAIERRAIHLGEIVERLLLSSRIEAGRVELERTEVDVTAIATEQVDAVGTSRDYDIALAIQPGTPKVWGDVAALSTVIDHLIDNAVKYSTDGSPISVAIGHSSNTVEIEVADRGIGMTDDELAHCFDRFWQAESGDDRTFAGTGIGLYIVRSMVEAMGGSIQATSEPGLGSMFSVTLRRADLPFGEPDGDGDDPDQPFTPEPSVIREFMRQIGVERRGT